MKGHDDIRVQSFEEAEQHFGSFVVNRDQLEKRVRHIEKCFDTLNSPVLKRLLFRIDGWGPWYQVRKRPHWRPWRGWWTS